MPIANDHPKTTYTKLVMDAGQAETDVLAGDSNLGHGSHPVRAESDKRPRREERAMRFLGD